MSLILPCLQIFLSGFHYISAVFLLILIFSWIYKLLRG